ncbi:MAG: holo-ACP synthase [Planctomycetes bacterium]|nr:holo-ACP synthase [Planctomycetota bacterium]
MAIVSIGSDITRIDRMGELLERRGEALKERLFTEREQAYCEARKTRVTNYAGRFAVKEAVMKVLGTGWAQGVRWVDIETLRERGQAPRLVLHGKSAEIARARGIERIHITITHDAGLAMAFAVGESD